jgi:serine protease Do
VVHIEANKSSKPHGNSEQGVTEAGSGAIVCIQGTTCVLSNFHVVRDCATDHIQIVLTTGRRLSPKRVLGDSLTDVAVLMLPADQDLVPIPVADSNDVEIGDFVLAFGSPFGLSHSVSHGIVSAKGRRNLDLGIGDVKIQDFIQTDAAINPGNSGGPLLNLRGELIGLNTAIASNSGGNDGIAFSIPSSLAHRVAEELIQRGRVARPYLGVHLEQNQPFSNPIPFDRSQPLGGARVTRVNQGSMAAEAGVLEGDVIARVNGQVVSDEAHLRTLVGILGVEGTCNLTVVREGKCIELPVALRERMQR